MTHKPLAQRIEEYQVEDKKRKLFLVGLVAIVALLLLGGGYLVWLY